MLALKLLFSMSGRMNRTSYILISLIAGVLGGGLALGLDLAANTTPGGNSGNAALAIMLLSIYSQAAMLTKRIRDTGKSTSLVWVYYLSLVLGLVAVLFGVVSPIALVLGISLLGVSVIITLYAMFAKSAADGNSKSSALDGLASSDPLASAIGGDDYYADADAIIARALEKRRETQQPERKDVLHPLTRGTTPAAPPRQSSTGPTVGFGRRNTPAFGNR